MPQILFFIYMIPATYYTFLFNWYFFLDHGFLAWIFFGEVIATFKGLLWPFFI